MMEGARSHRPDWVLSQSSLEKLLALLDPDPNAAATKYETLRRKLTKFFEWRGCPFPDEHADETINRVSRRAEQGESIRNVSTYAYGVARLQFMEILRKTEQDLATLATSRLLNAEADAGSMAVWTECFESCLGKLEPDLRKLLLQYYRDEGRAKIEGRKALADQLAVTVETLRIRAHRARAKLEACVNDCVKKAAGGEEMDSEPSAL